MHIIYISAPNPKGPSHIIPIQAMHLFRCGCLVAVLVLLATTAQAQTNASLVAEARAAVTAQELDKASSLIEEGLGAAPNDGSLLNLRGLVNYFRADWEGAEADFARAAEASPDSLDFQVNRAYALVNQGQMGEALAQIDRSLEQSPDDVSAWTARGFANAMQGDLNSALTDYSKAIELDSKPADVYFRRAQVFEAKGLNERAVQDLTAYIERVPTYDVAYSNRGLNKGRLDDFEGALEDFNKALEINPANAVTLINRAATHDNLDRVDEAISDYEAALAIDQTNELAYQNLASIYWRRGDMLEVVGVADHAMANMPDDALGFNMKAAAFIARKASVDELDEAATLAGRAKDLAPDDPQGHSNSCAALIYLAVAQKITHAMSNLIGDCETAIELDPDYVDAYEHLAVAYLVMGDEGKSNEANQKADEIRQRLSGE